MDDGSNLANTSEIHNRSFPQAGNSLATRSDHDDKERDHFWVGFALIIYLYTGMTQYSISSPPYSISSLPPFWFCSYITDIYKYRYVAVNLKISCKFLIKWMIKYWWNT